MSSSLSLFSFSIRYLFLIKRSYIVCIRSVELEALIFESDLARVRILPLDSSSEEVDEEMNEIYLFSSRNNSLLFSTYVGC